MPEVLITSDQRATVETILHDYCDDERPGASTTAFWAAVHYLHDVTTLDSGARQSVITQIQTEFERTHRCATY